MILDITEYLTKREQFNNAISNYIFFVRQGFMINGSIDHARMIKIISLNDRKSLILVIVSEVFAGNLLRNLEEVVKAETEICNHKGDFNLFWCIDWIFNFSVLARRFGKTCLFKPTILNLKSALAATKRKVFVHSSPIIPWIFGVSGRVSAKLSGLLNSILQLINIRFTCPIPTVGPLLKRPFFLFLC